MVKTVIALRGHENSGKTETIRKAARLFGEMHGVALDSVTIRVSPLPEILCMYQINSPELKVGFTSCGDDPGTVEENLGKLKKCDIIVCAIRETKKIVDAVEQWCNSGVKLIWAEQVVVGLCDANNMYKRLDAWFLYEDIFNKRNSVMANLLNRYVTTEINNWNAQS